MLFTIFKTFTHYFSLSKYLYSNLNKKGKLSTLESVTDVVAPNFDPSYQPKTDPNNPTRFGVKDVQDLTWKNLLDAYSCTECGRCTSSCHKILLEKNYLPVKL
jgi:ferredoxin